MVKELELPISKAYAPDGLMLSSKSMLDRSLNGSNGSDGTAHPSSSTERDEDEEAPNPSGSAPPIETKADLSPGDLSREVTFAPLVDGADVSDGDSTSYGSDVKDPSESHGSGSNETAPVLAHKETRNVIRSKILVYMVLLVSAGTVGFLTYFFLSQEENIDFETQFLDFSTEIIESAESNAETFLGKLETLSDTITAFSLESGTWPNVTIQNFDVLTTESFENFVGPELYLFAPIVLVEQKKAFEAYAVENQGWIKEDLFYRGLQNINPGSIPNEMYSYYGDNELVNEFSVPIWQVGPVPTNADIIMLDLYTQPSFRRMIDDARVAGHILLSEVVESNFLSDSIETLDKDLSRQDHPRSYAVQPIFDTFGSSTASEMVGFLFSVVPWDTYFHDVLPVGTEGFLVQVVDSCGGHFTYRLNGPDAIFLGEDYEPESKFDYLVRTAEFAAFARFDDDESDESNEILHCSYTLSVHATSAYAKTFTTNKPLYITLVVLMVFLFTAMVFVLYDFFVQRRQNKVMKTAQRTTAIVTSLFPKSVVKKMMESDDGLKNWTVNISGKDKLRNFFDGGEDESHSNNQGDEKSSSVFNTKPIADFFPDTTIMFADIVGFTAWSSTREPTQVFILLETIYHEFDLTAKARRVFKVETVGDCYVAVAGLPDPRKDHALVMARFARECLSTLSRLTKELEVTLGPDTADLGMRVGLHSGPVTAGVLRGDRARFQLFGDTMNMASRMESTCMPNRIQVSADFAKCLQEANKLHWIKPREDMVDVKGKGSMQTYWLEFSGDSALRKAEHASAEASSEEGNSEFSELLRDDCSSSDLLISERAMSLGSSQRKLSPKVERLVDWNADLLTNILKEIVARRESNGMAPASDERMSELENQQKDSEPLSEVQEIIKLPAFKQGRQRDVENILIDEKVIKQLHLFVMKIALTYHDNPFHNFEHASHVTMSVAKLLARIVAPDMENLGGEKYNDRGLYDHTYGITSDPITQFAVVVSALVHDTDHPGVPNSQLIKEETCLSKKYNGKSVAEQNSVDLAWTLLLKDEYKELRRTIYTTEREFKRFRHLVVNTVLATDIMDKDLKQLRNNRWDKAFKEGDVDESNRDKINRKATIVIEHLIQASDVAHTMQHWHVYRKWNARLFEEMYKAYVEGRAEKDPSEFWYKGEIGFLDFYVIPLAKKLKDCGVFGVSSDEYLQYAVNNRNEWERKGEDAVEDLIKLVKSNPNYKRLDAKRIQEGGQLVNETQLKKSDE